MAAGLTGGGLAGGGEARAAEVVHAQPAFRTSVMARAESHSGRVAQRWAPEGPEAAQAPAMRSLGFADRVIVRTLGSGVSGEQAGWRAGGTRGGAVDRRVAPMDWLFPIPWYLDELDWVAAARAAAWESERAAVRSGEASAASRAAARSEARAQVQPEIRFDLPIELVAPSLAASSSSSSSSSGSRPAAAAPAWRAYSPMVDPAAARAAELLANLVARSAAGVGGAVAGPAAEVPGGDAALPFRPAPILEYVAPSELAGGPAAEEIQRARVANAARQTLEEARQASAVQAQATAEARARAEAQAQMVARAREESRAAGRGETPAGGAPEAARAAAQAAHEATRAERAAEIEAERAAGLSRAEAAQLTALQGERAEIEAAQTRAARAESVRVEAARIEAARIEAARVASQQQSSVLPSVSAARRAVELLAMSALTGGESMAPSAGPRVLMPAGLGGLVAAADTSRAIHQPVFAGSGAAAPRRARGARAPRTSSSFATRPAALDHLLWSDRWLARFAGASGGALRSFDVARTPVLRSGAAAEWQPAWVSPPLPSALRRATPAAAVTGAAAAPARILTAPVLDDDQPVGDDVFGAIAAAAAGERHRRQRRSARPRPAGPAEPVGPFRMAAADRALAHVSMPRTAGLGSSLGASPIAALLANLLDSPTHAAFDARPLSSRSVSDFLARGAATAGMSLSAAQLARRAPGSVWLSMPSAAEPFAGRAPWRGTAPAVTATSPVGRPALSLVAPVDHVLDPAAAPTARARATAGVSSAALASAAAAGRAADARTVASLSAPSAAARPGSIAGEAESFARRRSMAVADLALDFLSPEVLVAARSFGFGPIDAVRAQRLAASGRPEMARLASMVDQVFVAALAPGHAAAGQDQAALAGRAAAGELAHLAPTRTPRGSFLVPAASGRALGLTPAQAEQARPGIGAALDLVAAGQVAEVAAQRSTAAAGAPGLELEPGAVGPAPDPLSLAAAAHREANALERSAGDAARALLPAHLRPVFDAVYLSLGEETTASDVRPLAPAARAARALALASRARVPEDLPISARARAAAAWAVLPVVLTGGAAAGASTSTAGASARSAAAAAASGRPPTARGAPLETGAPLITGERSERDPRSMASRAGTALASLVAPSFFRADDRGDGYAPAAASARAAVSTTFVETSSTASPAPAPAPRPAPAAARPSAPAQPAQQAGATQAQFEAWFKEAAKKHFGEAPSEMGLSIAEMTLVTAAPRAQIAASEMTASRPTQNAATAAPAAAPGAAPGGTGNKPDIDKIAQDVYDQIVRMLDVARERNGDPWTR